jgi:hypothetical protein
MQESELMREQEQQYRREIATLTADLSVRPLSSMR